MGQHISSEQKAKALASLQNGDIAALSEQICKHPQLCSAEIVSGGWRLFHLATKRGNAEELSILISALTKSIQNSKNKYSLDKTACSAKVAHCLNLERPNGCTCLSIAAKWDLGEVAYVLLRNGADPWIGTNLNRGRCYPVHIAVKHGSEKALQAILELSAPSTVRPTERVYDAQTISHFRPLHYAAWFNRVRCAGMLLACDCALSPHSWITYPSEEILVAGSSTPLHLAAMRGHREMVKLLLGTFVRRRSNTEPESLHRHFDMFDPRVLADARGSLPYTLACRKGHMHLLDLLLPTTPLESLYDDLFDSTTEEQLGGVPLLKVLAGRAVFEHFMTTLDALDLEWNRVKESRVIGGTSTGGPAPPPMRSISAAELGSRIEGSPGQQLSSPTPHMIETAMPCYDIDRAVADEAVDLNSSNVAPYVALTHDPTSSLAALPDVSSSEASPMNTRAAPTSGTRQSMTLTVSPEDGSSQQPTVVDDAITTPASERRISPATAAFGKGKESSHFWVAEQMDCADVLISLNASSLGSLHVGGQRNTECPPDDASSTTLNMVSECAQGREDARKAFAEMDLITFSSRDLALNPAGATRLVSVGTAAEPSRFRKQQAAGTQTQGNGGRTADTVGCAEEKSKVRERDHGPVGGKDEIPDLLTGPKITMEQTLQDIDAHSLAPEDGATLPAAASGRGHEGGGNVMSSGVISRKLGMEPRESAENGSHPENFFLNAAEGKRDEKKDSLRQCGTWSGTSACGSVMDPDEQGSTARGFQSLKLGSMTKISSPFQAPFAPHLRNVVHHEEQLGSVSNGSPQLPGTSSLSSDQFALNSTQFPTATHEQARPLSVPFRLSSPSPTPRTTFTSHKSTAAAAAAAHSPFHVFSGKVGITSSLSLRSCSSWRNLCSPVKIDVIGSPRHFSGALHASPSVGGSGSGAQPGTATGLMHYHSQMGSNGGPLTSLPEAEERVAKEQTQPSASYSPVGVDDMGWIHECGSFAEAWRVASPLGRTSLAQARFGGVARVEDEEARVLSALTDDQLETAMVMFRIQRLAHGIHSTGGHDVLRPPQQLETTAEPDENLWKELSGISPRKQPLPVPSRKEYVSSPQCAVHRSHPGAMDLALSLASSPSRIVCPILPQVASPPPRPRARLHSDSYLKPAAVTKSTSLSGAAADPPFSSFPLSSVRTVTSLDFDLDLAGERHRGSAASDPPSFSCQRDLPPWATTDQELYAVSALLPMADGPPSPLLFSLISKDFLGAPESEGNGETHAETQIPSPRDERLSSRDSVRDPSDHRFSESDVASVEGDFEAAGGPLQRTLPQPGVQSSDTSTLIVEYENCSLRGSADLTPEPNPFRDSSAAKFVSTSSGSDAVATMHPGTELKLFAGLPRQTSLTPGTQPQLRLARRKSQEYTSTTVSSPPLSSQPRSALLRSAGGALGTLTFQSQSQSQRCTCGGQTNSADVFSTGVLSRVGSSTPAAMADAVDGVAAAVRLLHRMSSRRTPNSSVFTLPALDPSNQGRTPGATEGGGDGVTLSPMHRMASLKSQSSNRLFSQFGVLEPSSARVADLILSDGGGPASVDGPRDAGDVRFRTVEAALPLPDSLPTPGGAGEGVATSSPEAAGSKRFNAVADSAAAAVTGKGKAADGAPAPAAPTNLETVLRLQLEDADDEGMTCPVCFDSDGLLVLRSCRHCLCIACAKELIQLHKYQPTLCPLCRQIIRGMDLLEEV